MQYQMHDNWVCFMHVWGFLFHGFPWWESRHFSIPKNRRNGNWTKLCKNHYLDQTCTAEDQALFFSRSGSGIQTGLCFWFGSCISGISQELLNLTSICAKEHWFGSKPLAGTRMQEVQCMQQESCTVKCKGKGAQSLYATDLVPAPGSCTVPTWKGKGAHTAPPLVAWNEQKESHLLIRDKEWQAETLCRAMPGLGREIFAKPRQWQTWSEVSAGIWSKIQFAKPARPWTDTD